MHTQDVGCLFFAFLFIGYAVGILIGVPNLWIYLGVLFFALYFSK